jgi:hypothetical protein
MAYRAALNVTWSGYPADLIVAATASGYSSLPYRLSRIGRFERHMRTIVRTTGIIYLTQAGAGLAIGFTLPWLRFFGVI